MGGGAATVFARALDLPQRPEAARPRVPDGTLVYAIGDIHGRLDLLDALHALVLADAAARRATRRLVIYLGDYLSRGPCSRQVVERLLGTPLPGFEVVRLRGNHEDLATRFLAGEMAAGADWLDYGGVQALASYGIEADAMTLPDLRDAFDERLPAAHRSFLEALAVSHAEGDYYFVHAGVEPGLPLAEQRRAARMWIRRRFLESELDHGACVVHGHSICESVELRPNRIGIDTGAYASGVLSCLVLQGAGAWLLATAGRKLDLVYPVPHEGGGKGSV